MEEINFQLRRSQNFLIFHIAFPLPRTTLDPSLDYPRRRTHITHHFDPPLGRSHSRSVVCDEEAIFLDKFAALDTWNLILLTDRNCVFICAVVKLRPGWEYLSNVYPFVSANTHTTKPSRNFIPYVFVRSHHPLLLWNFPYHKKRIFFFIIPCNFPAPSEQKKLRMRAKGAATLAKLKTWVNVRVSRWGHGNYCTDRRNWQALALVSLIYSRLFLHEVKSS